MNTLRGLSVSLQMEHLSTAGCFVVESNVLLGMTTMT